MDHHEPDAPPGKLTISARPRDALLAALAAEPRDSGGCG